MVYFDVHSTFTPKLSCMLRSFTLTKWSYVAES